MTTGGILIGFMPRSITLSEIEEERERPCLIIHSLESLSGCHTSGLAGPIWFGDCASAVCSARD
jgi:hypothetical protein